MQGTIAVEPEPRLDTLVRRAADGTEVRRTEYAGAAWLNGRPVAQGMLLAPGPTAARGIQSANVDVQFFLPDSLPYTPPQLEGAQLQVSVALRGADNGSAILYSAASFVVDPRGEPIWIQLRVAGRLMFPEGITYRVVALTPTGGS